MSTTTQPHEVRATARQLLRFLDEMMRTIVRVELGDPALAQLTLLEMRVLIALGDRESAIALREIAAAAETSVGQAGQASDRLRGRGLVERAGGGRGERRALAITRRGRRLLASLAASRQAGVERFLAELGPSERLRVEGAAHLLGRDLDRLAGGMLAT